MHVQRSVGVNGEGDEPHGGLIAAPELIKLQSQLAAGIVQPRLAVTAPSYVVSPGSSHEVTALGCRNLQEETFSSSLMCPGEHTARDGSHLDSCLLSLCLAGSEPMAKLMRTAPGCGVYIAGCRGRR